jgi:cell cycle checkpoint protein
MDLPPTCTKITLTAMPADTTHPPELLEATGSSNQRRYHRADVGGFSITAKGDFGQTDVSSFPLVLIDEKETQLIRSHGQIRL